MYWKKYTLLQEAWKPKLDDYIIYWDRHLDSNLKKRLDVFTITSKHINSIAFKDWAKEGLYIWLPRIDQHIAILKKCGYLVETAESIFTHKFMVKLYDRNSGDFIKMPKAIENTLEKAFDKACEWALANKEKDK